MTSLLVRRLMVDVSAAGDTWHPLTGVTIVDPLVIPRVIRRTRYSGGWGGSYVLGHDWTLAVTYTMRAHDVDNRPDAQQLIEDGWADIGGDARLYVRWYDRGGLWDGRQGRATYATANAATGSPNIARVSVLFTGEGPLDEIDNPLA